MNGGQPAAYVLHPGGQNYYATWRKNCNSVGKSAVFVGSAARYGNLSSASVLFVLQEWMEHGKLATGDYGLLAAFGPGFSAEMLMLQWA